ncbi:MAG TPA: GTPase, partial [Magnetospirillaceae bacterium]|nr:GTPase [Magnetospirillaceae bacterium]
MPRGYLPLDVPIAALATAPVPAALAVVRTSGPGAPELAARVFSRPRALAGAGSRRAVYGRVLDPETGRDVDEVVALVFRAPSGYTGQDAVDFVCHGGLSAWEGVLDALGKAGFERALPGEFTFRAFSCGKLDLAAAEAVDELVRARTRQARDGALERLAGGLSRGVRELRDAVLAALAEAEARLDYGEDELEGGPGELAAFVEAARVRAGSLAASHAVGRILAEGARVALAGRTNSGKSRLFNLFLKEERSIVAESPGTTRDYIEASVDLDGVPLTLFDTAGLRDAPDPVEAEGVRRSRLVLAGADLALYLVDGTLGVGQGDLAALADLPGAIRIWNKTDLPGALPAPEGWIPLSAATGEGFPALTAQLTARLAGRHSLAEGPA